jgi:hypothetical protein
MDSHLPYSFDVRSLYNNQADHQLQGDNNESFRVNICGSLHEPCNGLDNVSVCLKRGGKEIAIGKIILFFNLELLIKITTAFNHLFFTL